MSVVVVLVAVALIAALFALSSRSLISRRTNEHDPAWKPTGIRQVHAGHDQAQGERGFRASIARDARVRRAAATKAKPRTSSKVTPIGSRRRA